MFQTDEGVLHVMNALGLTEEGRKRMEDNRVKRLEELSKMKIETNANEVVHTGNTGYGAELIPTNVLQSEIFDALPKYSTFLTELPGFHGFNMGVSEDVSVIGDPGFFQGNGEWTTGAGTIVQGNSKQPTGKVTINQASFIMSIDVSKRELNYAVGDLESLLKDRIAAAWARTAESALINGDTVTAGTGNVNSDDQAPATTFASLGGAQYHVLKLDNGLVKLGVGATIVNAGTLDITDLIDVENKVGDYFADPSQCLWLFNRKTYNKMKGIAAFYDASQRGESSTLSGKAITNIDGADLFVARDLGLAEADGKLSGATPANNTLGRFLLFWKPAVQHGYGQNFELDVVKVPGKGVSIIATVEWGFSIVQQKAGITDSSVGLAANITV